MPTFRKQGEVSEKAAGRKLEILNIYFSHLYFWTINTLKSEL